MEITFIEQIGIVVGIVTGVSGFIYSVVQSRRQRRYEREQAAYAREQAAEREAFERGQAAEQEAFEREQAAKQEAFEREQAAERALNERLYFLANLIVDKSIPRMSRQIFFDEYLAKGGNGSFVKFWFDEGKELEAKKEGMGNR
ncbi:MAG: hypothetical protein LBS79_06610 [Tannerella sp.]|jgi:hypothetical protein|nr:hypothetical protein [Tannerella sp.]